MAHSESRVDYTFKTIIIGESAAGKSSLLAYFISGKPSEKVSRHTVGVEFASRTIIVSSNVEEAGSAAKFGGSSIIKLQIWDTAGQDRFRSVTRSYYRGAVCCMLCFALNDRSSYEKVPLWLKDARQQAGDEVTIVLVGNKSDLEAERQVTLLEASQFAQANGCAAYIETSALNGDNVEAAFFKMARCVLSKIEAGSLDAAAFSSTGALPATSTKLSATGDADATGAGCSC